MGLLKIFQNSFKSFNISENCVSFVNGNVDFAIGIKPAVNIVPIIGTELVANTKSIVDAESAINIELAANTVFTNGIDFGDIIGFSIRSNSNIGRIRMAFKPFEKIGKKK